ncbi:MAG TPA: NAD(+) kinase [Campylobacterales bacterium]|nr:NAD(+) kinase [Campylobacterales bacterium]HHH51302.1 NAD(+) kinase [Campylobacterales bacterium]
MSEKLNHIKKVGFVLRPDSPNILPIYNDIKSKFENKGIEVLLGHLSANMVGLNGINFHKMCQEVDILVSLGGDGTLLSLVRKSYGYDKPVLGINAGNLGFLADTPINCVDDMVDKLLVGDYRIDNRMMIEGYIERENDKEEFYAFNDVVITRPTISHMVKLDASIDGDWFNTYRGDGLIISTPTGSTAYNLSLGGPIMYPLSKVFIMTPVAPHSLTQRPLVVPSDFTIEMTSPDELVIMVDGQDNYSLKATEKLVIKGAEMSAKLLHKKEHSYFKVLREKLSWGDE